MLLCARLHWAGEVHDATLIADCARQAVLGEDGEGAQARPCEVDARAETG